VNPAGAGVVADAKLSHRADVVVSYLQNPNRQQRCDITGGLAAYPKVGSHR